MSRLSSYQSTTLDKFAILQVLNKQTRGLFLKNSELDIANWIADPTEISGCKFNHVHRFGMMADSPEQGILFTSPRLLIIHRSPVIVEDTFNNNIAIGELGNPNIDELFQQDKEDATTNGGKRRYNARSKWLLFVLKDNNQLAHSNPIVLSFKGLNTVVFSEAYTTFRRAATTALNVIKQNPVTNLKAEERFYTSLVFQPTFGSVEMGTSLTEVCGIVSQELPTPDNLESDFLVSEFLENFIQTLLTFPAIKIFWIAEANQTSARLNGAYGVSPHYLPASNPTEIDALGEDAA